VWTPRVDTHEYAAFFDRRHCKPIGEWRRNDDAPGGRSRPARPHAPKWVEQKEVRYFASVQRRAFIRSGSAVRINAVGLNRYSAMVLGIVRLLRADIGDGSGLVGCRVRYGARIGVLVGAQAGRGGWLEWRVRQTRPRSRQRPLAKAVDVPVHGGPRDGRACMTGSIRRVREPQASQCVRSRPIRTSRVMAVIGVGGFGDGPTTPK
jgi:hypothetical protein